MTLDAIKDLTLLRNALTGANLKKLLNEKKITIYRLAKALNVDWMTAYYWTKGKHRPNDTNVILIAKYLGLIAPDEADLHEIKRQLNELQDKYERLSQKTQEERR